MVTSKSDQVQEEVKNIWYHLRGNGEVGLLEQTRRNTETLDALKEDMDYVKQSIADMKEHRATQAAEMRGFKRGLYIAGAIITLLGTGGGAIIVNLLTEIANSLP